MSGHDTSSSVSPDGPARQCACPAIAAFQNLNRFNAATCREALGVQRGIRWTELISLRNACAIR